MSALRHERFDLDRAAWEGLLSDDDRKEMTSQVVDSRDIKAPEPQPRSELSDIQKCIGQQGLGNLVQLGSGDHIGAHSTDYISDPGLESDGSNGYPIY